ncbi:MAG TPA: NAD(P)H-binding protein, partial [Steroidobacteraceae bacterium]|nr:NAD(P)H-binding protein [Steroidobacteraceae bacterium]
EEYLKASGLEYTIIGPGGLVAGAPSQTGIRLTRREDYRRAMIARADVARVAIASLTLPAARNRSFAIVNDADLAPDQWLDALLALPADPPAR